MKRTLIVLAVLLLVLLVGGYLFGGRLAGSAVERAGERALGVETRVGGLGLGLRPTWLGGAGLGHCSLNGLRVANPEGFDAEHLLELDRAAIEVPPTALLADRVEIPLVELEGIRLVLEQRGTSTNYGRVMEHLEEVLGSEEEQEPAPGERSFVIRELRVANLTAAVDLGGLAEVAGDLQRFEVTVPELVLTDVGAEGSLTRVVGEVVSVLLAAVLEAGAGELPAEVLAQLEQGLEGVTGELERMGEQAGEVLRDVIEDAFPESLPGDLLKKRSH
jgi:hypothetical protein